MNICKIKKDDLAKRIELRLLSINDSVAAEVRYVTCRTNFENPFSVSTLGRPVERDKQENFEKACIAMENNMELYTVSEFQKLKSEIAKELETEDLSWVHFDDQPRLQERQQLKDQQSYISVSVAYPAIPSSN